MLAERFREIFSALAAGVSVVTFDVEGQVHGFTVTSLTPVSMAPPLALFCVARHGKSCAYLRRGTRLGISILNAAQRRISQRFSEKVELGGYKDIAITRGPLGAPVVSGAGATLEARITELHPAGDHLICVCELESGQAEQTGEPLLYFSRRYHGLAVLADNDMTRASYPKVAEG